jgi:hypothetical protein
MYQNLQQLKTLSYEELKVHKKNAGETKAELEALKTKGGKAWTQELQEKLNEVTLFLVDLEEAMEEKEALEVEETEPKGSYVPQKGTEKMVHLSIVQGRRFNPMSGKEESAPYIQMFTYPEWQLFKKHFRSLGYFIMSVLHDPYGEASELVTKA